MLGEKRNDYKKAILESGLDKELAKAHYQDFREGSSRHINAYVEAYGNDLVSVGLALNNAKYKRKQRVQDRLGFYIACGDCVFLTLTFDDETLKNTSAETRRRYVSRFLKENSTDYVANIDFGGKKGREHYHAVAVIDEKIDPHKWKYGNLDLKRIRNTHGDVEASTRYLVKLSNHAMKVDGCAPRLIYSRKSVKELPPAWLLED